MRVSQSAEAGNGLFTLEDIAAGEEILHMARPLTSVLDSLQLQTRYAECFREGTADEPEDWKEKLSRCLGV